MRRLIRPWLKWRLYRIHIAGRIPELSADRPLMICCNHVSWWDGFVVDELIERIQPGATRIIVMLERELRRKPPLRWVGCIGLVQGSVASLRRVYRTIQEGVQAEPSLVLVLFPQGRIWPSSRRPLGFEPGARLFARALGPATLIPVALHVQPGGRRSAASAYASVLEPRPIEMVHDLRGVESRIETELDRIITFLETHGEDAPDLWNDHYVPTSLPARAEPDTDTKPIHVPEEMETSP